MPTALFADQFRNPLGTGLETPENDGDGFYVAFGFDQPNPDIGGSYHLGVDWNGEGGGNTDLGDPVHAIGNATVVSVVSDQGASTTGFGNYVVLRHDFSEPTLINGQWVTHVHSLYAHLDTVGALSVGQEIGIGQQIGTLGMSGYADVAHLHLEITLGDTLPTSYDGYNHSGAPSSWVDPVSFIQSNLTQSTPELAAAQIIEIGTAFARASYGGSGLPIAFQGTWRDCDDELNYDDNYRGYVASLSATGETWRLLDQADLGMTLPLGGENFTAGGLYRSGVGWFGDPDDENAGEALVAERIVNGERTVVISFRGSDGIDALTERQTFDEESLRNYYEGMRPLLEAVALYVSPKGVENVIVSGHSLGGTIADLFGLADADLFSGVNLSIVSIASAGLEPDITDFTSQLSLDLSASTLDPITGNLLSVGFSSDVDHYFGITHSEDRVHHPWLDQMGDELTPTTPLIWNVTAPGNFLINLPNLTNTQVVYEECPHWYSLVTPFQSHGFGAEHNGELYWANVSALATDTLFGQLANHNIVMGLTDYSQVRDLDGAVLPGFQSYTGINDYRYYDDSGLRALLGTSAADYILGLDGDDRLIGYAGDDLLSGGNGDDRIDGRAGRDLLAGGAGVDELVGGAQGDIFVFSEGDYPLFQSINPDRITDYNQGSDIFSAIEGDLIDLSSFHFATNTGLRTSSFVRLRTIEASGGLPAGALLEGKMGTGIWQAIARLDGISAGQSVKIALTNEQSAGRTGTNFIVDATAESSNWSISPQTRSVTEGDVTITFTISRPDANLDTETVYVSTVQTAGYLNQSDYYGLLDLPVVFATGEKSKSVSVTIREDSDFEGNETFGLIVQRTPIPDPHDYLAIATFEIRDDEVAQAGNTPTEGDDVIRIIPVAGTQHVNLLGGTDRAVIDMSAFTEAVYFQNIGGSGLRARSGAWDGSKFAYETYIYQTEATDFYGGSSDDYISTSGITGNDNLFGNGGNDTLDGREGDDLLEGGSGNDTLSGGTGADVLRGGSGDDYLDVRGGGADLIDGGSGTDKAYIDRSAETQAFEFTFDPTSDATIALQDGTTITDIENIHILLGSGNDTVTLLLDPTILGTQHVSLLGGTDRAVIDMSAFTEAVYFQNISGSGLRARSGAWDGSKFAYETYIYQTEATDFYGGSSDDYISTSGITGNDNLFGNGGNDTLDGREGDDLLEGGSGNDTLSGGTGADVLRGGSGDDYLDVRGGGADLIDGGSGTDKAYIDRSAETQAFEFTFDPTSDATIALQDGTTITDIENIHILLGSGNDTVTLLLDPTILGTQHVSLLGGTDRAVIDMSAFTEAVYFQNISGSGLRARSGAWDGSKFAYETYIYQTEATDFYGGSSDDYISTSGITGNDNLFGNGGNDTLDGREGDDLLEGGSGNDTLSGGTGADVLRGGSGDDYLDVRGGGADLIDGGSGTDKAYIDRSAETQAFEFTFDPTSDATIALQDGTTITDIENIHILLGSGNDTVTLLLDPTILGTQHVSLLGGTDRAVIDMSAFTEAVYFQNISGSGLRARSGAWDGSKFAYETYIYQTEATDFYGGSSDDYISTSGITGNDNLFGNGGNDTLDGREGDDLLEGGSGNDTLSGGTGADVLRGGSGDDYLDVRGGGADLIDGGSGTDKAYIDRSAETQAFEFTFDPTSDATIALQDGTTITDIENIHILLGSGNDTVTLLLDPTILGTQHVSLLGGTDRAVIDMSAFTEAVYFQNISGSGLRARSGAWDGSKFAYETYIYQTEATDFYGGSSDDYISTSGITGNDNLFGNGGNDTLDGREGDDLLEGGSGNDTLSGGTGADVLRGGSGDDYLDVRGGGADLIDGGSGTDKAYIDRSAETQAFEFTFDPTSDATIALQDGTTITDIENIHILLGSGNDTVTLLLDPTILGTQHVSLLGGTDRAVIDMSAFTEAVYFQNISGSGLRARSGAWDGSKFAYETYIYQTEATDFYGGSSDDYISTSGITGNDNLFGNGGNDTLDGREGDDLLEGGSGNDTLSGGTGADVLRGGSGDDYIAGDSGNDFLEGGNGADSLFGDDGVDTLSYATSTAGVAVYLARNKVSGGHADGDTVSGFENLIGSDHVDRLIGDLGDNHLSGGDSDDIIKSNGGTDTLNGDDGDDKLIGDVGHEVFYGGDGLDTIRGIDGNDYIHGGDDEDYLYGNRNIDTVDGGEGNDRVFGGNGNDHLLGGAGDFADYLFGGRGNDKLIGDNGNDELFGGNGRDYLYGGDGNDTLEGGQGDDRLFGGVNADTFVFGLGDGSDRIRDFELGVDSADIAEFGLANLNAILAIATNNSAGVRLDFATGEMLLFENITKAQLDIGDFILA